MIQKLSLLICSALLPSTAYAVDESPWTSETKPGLAFSVMCHKDDPSRCVVRIRAGEMAPFPGVLETFTQQAVLQVQGDPEKIQKRIDAEVKKATKNADNDLNLEKKYHQIDNDAWAEKEKKTEENHELQMDVLRRQLPDWYEEPWFVGLVSVAGTLVVVGGSVAIACSLSGGCK